MAAEIFPFLKTFKVIIMWKPEDNLKNFFLSYSPPRNTYPRIHTHTHKHRYFNKHADLLIPLSQCIHVGYGDEKKMKTTLFPYIKYSEFT